MFQELINEESGQTLVEYGILVALIALVVLVSLSVLGKRVDHTFDDVADAFGSKKAK